MKADRYIIIVHHPSPTEFASEWSLFHFVLFDVLDIRILYGVNYLRDACDDFFLNRHLWTEACNTHLNAHLEATVDLVYLLA